MNLFHSIYGYNYPSLKFLVIPGVLFLLSCSGNWEPYYFLDVEITDQQVSERIIQEPLLRKIFQQSDFFRPVFLEVSEKGIFLLDAANDLKVSHFSWDFELVREIGRGQGRGPGEMGGLSDLHVSGDSLYFADVVNAAVHVYTLENEFIRSISIAPEIITRFLTFEDRFVVQTQYSSERLFFIDKQGNRLQESDLLTIDEVRYRFILSSRILSDEENLYRVPVYFGLLITYDREGNLISATHLVDPYESPFNDRTRDPVERPVGMERDAPEIVSANASIYRDNICVLRVYQRENRRFIDCYNTADSAYSFSFTPPDNTRDFKIFGNHFVAMHDTSLTVWEWDVNF